MLAGAPTTSCEWLRAGREIFPAMMEAIEGTQRSIRLEIYTYSPGTMGKRFLEVLVRARQRGVEVHVIVDAVGSINLPGDFWDPLRAVGGHARHFNPLSLHRLAIRNHRKSLVCDDSLAIIGGFNISRVYDGDGVTSGWCDLGLKLRGPIVPELAAAFDEMFVRADFQHKRFIRLRRTSAKRAILGPEGQLLLSGPGRGRNPIKDVLRSDLARAREVSIIVAYFLPTWRIRRELMQVVRRGGRVRLILAGKSDVLVSQLAGQSLYRRLLREGVEIYEYQPQILHAKLVIVDDAVYAGSANLDQRSLNINYELMIRFASPQIAGEAREIFAQNLIHCRRVTAVEWRESRSLWRRFKQRWAYFLLARIDPYVARKQWRRLPD